MNADAGRPRARFVLPGLVLLATAMGLPSIVRALGYLAQMIDPIDFRIFYVTALTFRVAPEMSFYDPVAFAAYCQSLGLGACAPPNYPPFIALVFYPFSLLSFDSAKTLWLAINVALTVGFSAWGWRQIPAARRAARGFAIWFIVLLPSLWETLLLGQINMLLGVLLWATITAAGRRRPRWDVLAGAILGLAAAIKLWPLFLAGYFLLRRRWRIVAASVVVFALLTLLGIVAVGTAKAWQYFGSQVGEVGVNAMQSAFPPNQSIWGVAARLFLGGTTESARLSLENQQPITVTPLLHSAALYWLAVVGFLLASAALLWHMARRVPEGDTLADAAGYWAVLVGVLTVPPFAWSHYAYLLLFPMVTLLCAAPWPRRRVMTLGAFCLTLMLVHRYWAWLPPWSWLLAFVFVAEVIMELALVATVLRLGARPA